MKVLLTGGSGDLASVLTPVLLRNGNDVVLLDVREPAWSASKATFIKGSILDREKLEEYMAGCDLIVHIAAWHGVHEFKGEKNAYDFFDLNVRGTFEVFEAARRATISRVVFLSSTSVSDRSSMYGNSKILAEQIASFYAAHYDMNVITLRPRAFIPHWNTAVYSNYIEWARWFWKGAVHIDDVAQSVSRSIEFLASHDLTKNEILTVDGAYDYSDEDLNNWDVDGPGSTFRKYYEPFLELVRAHGLNPEQKPGKLDTSYTRAMIGYEPTYSLRNLLEELNEYGAAGPKRT